MNSRIFNFFDKFRAETRRTKPPDDPSILISDLFKGINVGHGDDIALHTRYFGNVNDFTSAVPHTFLVND